MRLVRTYLPRAVEEPSDIDARGHMLLAASMAGQLVSMTFSGVAHAVAHALGLGWGVHHGTGNAVALAWSIRFNAADPPSAAAYARCAAAFGVPAAPPRPRRPSARALADAVRGARFAADLGLPARLGALGLGTRRTSPRLAALAFADPLARAEPREGGERGGAGEGARDCSEALFSRLVPRMWNRARQQVGPEPRA